MRDADPPVIPPEPNLRELMVPVTALDAPGRSQRRAVIAGGLVVVALGVAVISGALFPAGQGTQGPDRSGVANLSPGLVTPVPSRPAPTPGLEPPTQPLVWPQVPVLLRPDLANAMAEGRLDGRLVLVRDELAIGTGICPGPGACPPDVSVAGLDVPIGVAPELVPWDRDPTAGRALVFAGVGGMMVYQGSIVAYQPAPVTISTLLENPYRFLNLTDLYLVNGRLVGGGDVPCDGPIASGEPGIRDPASTCPGTPYLLDVMATGDSSGPSPTTLGRGAPVTVAKGAIGIPGDGTVGVVGTFLVRRMYRTTCDPKLLLYGTCEQQFVIRPQIVGRVSADTTLQIVVPPAAGTVTGQVVDAAGRPMVGFGIRVGDSAGHFAEGIQTDPDGRFVFDGLAPGVWTVEAVESMPEGDIVVGRSRALVRSGETTDVTIVATPGVALPEG